MKLFKLIKNKRKGTWDIMSGANTMKKYKSKSKALKDLKKMNKGDYNFQPRKKFDFMK